MLTTDKPILEEHLERFDFYARHIREFSLGPHNVSTGHRVSPHIYRSIERLRPDNAFPNLRRLTVKFPAILPEDLSFLLLLTSAALSYASLEELENVDVELFAASLLHTISMKSLGLCELEMQGYTRCILDLKRGFNDLCDLDLDFCMTPNTLIPQDLVVQLACLESLKRLQLALPSPDSNIPLLCGKACSIADATDSRHPRDCRQHSPFSPFIKELVNLTITFMASENDLVHYGKHYEQCINSIVRISRNLQVLRLDFGSRARVQISHKLLYHVISCKKLRDLTLTLDQLNGQVLSSLISMQEEWPALERLYFKPTKSWGPPENPNSVLLVSELVAFSTLFPNLKALCVPAVLLDMESQDTQLIQASISSKLPSHHKLRNLHLKPISASTGYYVGSLTYSVGM